MMKPVHSAIVDLLRARSGRVDDFEADLDAALDMQPEGCTHSDRMIDGIRWGSRAISAAHEGRAFVRVVTPDGASLTFDFKHTEARAQAVVQAIDAALHLHDGNVVNHEHPSEGSNL